MRSLENKLEEAAFYKHDADRAVAVAWSSIVENRLTDVLKAAMRPDTKVRNELFQPSGALGNFGTKIKLAYMLGIIAEDFYGDLIKVNKIRNEFAHKVEIVDFDQQPVCDWINGTKVVEIHKGLLETYIRESDDSRATKTKIFVLENELSDCRNRYHMIIRFMIHSLVKYEKEIKASGRIYVSKSTI